MNKFNHNGNRNDTKIILCLVLFLVLIAQTVFIVRLDRGESDVINTISMAEMKNVQSEEEADEGEENGEAEAPPLVTTAMPQTQATSRGNSRVIVLDAGHGKSSSQMSAAEKTASGWVQRSDGSWGEWRHWKSGTMWHDCEATGCNKRAPQNGGCWYPIGNGDRSTEPSVNMNNVLAAQKYLEQNGFIVRLARESNEENPSLTMRLHKCYPNDDITSSPDAIAYVCIHSNAGGGRGSAYLSLSSGYDHAYSDPDYAADGNDLGKKINDRIVSQTSMSSYNGGCYSGQPDLILFHKSPVPVAYLEIGFFDNASDLSILNSESDAIGKAIADGIMDYVTEKGL